MGTASASVLIAGVMALAFHAGTLPQGSAYPSADTTAAPPPYPREMNLAQSNYVEHFSGCHHIQGDAAPANLPSLRGRVGWFMCTPEARRYVIHLPNVSRSRITDNEDLADLLNFMVFGLGGASTPKGTLPFTGAEVARERAFPLTSVSLIKTRATLVSTLMKKCRAPASLKLMYPGQK